MNRSLATFLLACAILPAQQPPGQQIYDVLLKNGRVIDPANHRDAQLDVAVVGSRIVRVAPNLPEAHARVVVNVSGYLVTPGLIDSDIHLGTELKPDYNTLPYGVTTAVDVGSVTCAAFPEFKKEVIDHAKVRLLVMLSPGGSGCSQDAVVGVASQAAGNAGLILANARKSPPDSISSGMSPHNVLLQRANLSTAMSIFLNLGMAPEKVIERVTANPARTLKRPQLGNLSEGSAADIAILEIQQGKFGFLDSAMTRLDATRRFRCLLTMRNGAIVWDSDALSIPDTAKAGAYTNFK
jgi:predicted amidohydrolase